MRWRAGLVAVLLGCGASEPAAPMPSLLEIPRAPRLSPDDRCRPGGDDTHWGLEGDLLAVTVGCSLPLDLAPHAFELPELPPGARWDPSTGRLSWRPALDQAGVWHVPVRVPSLAESGYVHLGVVERWGAKGNEHIRHPQGYPEEYGLPVVHLFPEEGLTEEYSNGRLVYRGRTYPVELKYRGNTSLKYPKKSLTVKVSGGDFLIEPHFAGGFARRKFVLTSNFDDASYVRQRLAYDPWNALDPAHVPVKTYSVVVYFGGHPWGLYTLGDHVDKHLLEPNGIDKGANIYKAIRTQANFRVTRLDGRPKPYLWFGIDKKEGLPAQGVPDAFTDLEELIRTVDLGTDEELRSWLAANARVEDFTAWWALAVFGLTVDSVHKNVYFINAPERGPWRCVPWDFNASFGQDWVARRLPADEHDEFTRHNELFRRLLDDPSFDTRARLAEALDGPLSLARVQGLVDGYVAEIDAGARRDWARWGRLHQDYFDQPDASYDAELAYVRAWIDERWTVLRARYPRD